MLKIKRVRNDSISFPVAHFFIIKRQTYTYVGVFYEHAIRRIDM